MRVRALAEMPPQEVEALLARHRASLAEVMPRVAEIVARVRAEGDPALLHFTETFDGVRLERLEASPAEVEAAYAELPPGVLPALRQAIAQVERYHALGQAGDRWEELMPGVEAGWVVRPIERVGLYAPGGRAAYPSSVVMTGAPARLAGCPTRVLCVPPGRDGRVPAATLVAADLVGVERVFKVGGAQAIAALAYGTETIPATDKIFGAGNRWVTAAKVLVSQDVAIDMPAGPSEILILADETANPRWLAADLLAQAEHGPDSVCLLVTPSAPLAGAVAREVEALAAKLPRREMALQSLREWGALLVVPDLAAGVAFANRFAAEHLQIVTADPLALLPQIRHAGSVFLGPHSPVAAGDYAAGPNHVLPTSGHARAWSALSLAAFTRVIQVQRLSAEGLRGLARTVTTLAEVEGLTAHAQAVQVRLEETP